MNTRAQIFQAKNGQVDRKHGIHHLFDVVGAQDDYCETIKQGADEGIYGRYRDIENLGSDIQVQDIVEFKSSTNSSKKKFDNSFLAVEELKMPTPPRVTLASGASPS